ncbi:hypothetical protein ABXN37_29020 [Piscinibacter sakaiensis]|uniref:Uncharacterized protein n=1 Tax=Piscinibacter sakaiensis TaxID=1547922 RepID=A0A0K8P8T8_PISS1|nr:hypothetical protein [Piscinibacter sakaiensis]GAP39062.1 hypothetical protein ISF6_0775 [Piscinibacter sakaiensis]
MPIDRLQVHVLAALTQHLLADTELQAAGHAQQLNALLSAYTTVLVRHPCCWQAAGEGLRQCALLVESMAAQRLKGGAQPGAPFTHHH